MREETKILLAELRTSNLFSAVGHSWSNEFGPDTVPVRSWREAARYARSSDWQDIRLHARNELTGNLARCHPVEYQQWNDLVDEIKPDLIKILMPQVEAKVAEAELQKPILDSVTWDLLALMMESEYSHLIRPQFYAALGIIYLAGHYPCGWQGEYPDGKLLIY